MKSAEDLFPVVYDELRRLAASYLSGERSGHTLQPTALVHEAYLRLAGESAEWNSRTHVFAVGARVMRRLLIDHARGRGRDKRGGDWQRVTLDPQVSPVGTDLDGDSLIALDGALERLAALDQREARIVEMRFFSGLTIEEIAAELGVSKRTVEADWTHARAWLRRELSSVASP
jgi:RNA polymerase sigma factor (TIGR02999 family)